MKLEIGLLGRIKKKGMKGEVKQANMDKSQIKNKHDEGTGSVVKKVVKNFKKDQQIGESHQK